MPSLYDIKPAFQRLLRPVCLVLHQAGCTPNSITAATLVASVCFGAWMFAGKGGRLPFLILPVFLFLRMAANAVDGMMAREYNLCSASGAILNEVGDVLADAALYLPFAVLPGIHPLLPVGVVVLAALTEIAGLAGVAAGASRRFDGPMGKSDRAFVFGVFALLFGFGVVRNPVIWTVLFGVTAFLLIFTIFNRWRLALREIG